MDVILRFVGLLVLSNLFVTFAWYGHLKYLRLNKWRVAVLVSWGIAFFEYLLQVPANRLAYGTLRVEQLKILQEVITLAIFAPFAILVIGAADPPELRLGRALSGRSGLLHLQTVRARA